MASRGRKTPRDLAIEALVAVSRARPHPEHLWQSMMSAYDSLVVEGHTGTSSKLHDLAITLAGIEPIPDATFALTISTAVEQSLELAVSTFFELDDAAISRLFDDNQNGPLSSFAAKIKIGHALGIYPPRVREELDLIRHIRNAFAHSWAQLEFSTPQICEGCSQLRIPKCSTPEFVSTAGDNPKGQFFFSVRTMYIYLEWRPSSGPMVFHGHPNQHLLRALEAAP